MSNDDKDNELLPDANAREARPQDAPDAADEATRAGDSARRGGDTDQDAGADAAIAPDEDVNDDIAQAEERSADGEGDVNEYGIDALDISFDTEVDFDALPDDAIAALTGDATDADAAPADGANEVSDADAQEPAGTGSGMADDARPEDGESAADDDADAAARTAANGDAASAEELAGAAAQAPESAAVPKVSTESIVSSRIDAEVRRRRGIVAPDRYPVFALSDVSVARAKTGEPIIDHVDCAFFNGYVNAILVDSDEERQAVMALVAGLALPTVGAVLFRSKPLYEYDMHEYRGHEVGLVFQRFNLRPDLTVLRNITLAMEASGRNFLKSKEELAKERLAQAGFPADRADTPVRDLDAFELRRAEIARALCCEANMLILDEPTGGLDEDEADEIFATLERFVKRDDRCVIIVTGRESVADRCASAYAVNELDPAAERDGAAADADASEAADAYGAAADEAASDEDADDAAADADSSDGTTALDDARVA